MSLSLNRLRLLDESDWLNESPLEVFADSICDSPVECARLVAAFSFVVEICCPDQFALENAKLRQVAALHS